MVERHSQIRFPIPRSSRLQLEVYTSRFRVLEKCLETYEVHTENLKVSIETLCDELNSRHSRATILRALEQCEKAYLSDFLVDTTKINLSRISELVNEKYMEFLPNPDLFKVKTSLVAHQLFNGTNSNLTLLEAWQRIRHLHQFLRLEDDKFLNDTARALFFGVESLNEIAGEKMVDYIDFIINPKSRNFVQWVQRALKEIANTYGEATERFRSSITLVQAGRDEINITCMGYQESSRAHTDGYVFFGSHPLCDVHLDGPPFQAIMFYKTENELLFYSEHSIPCYVKIPSHVPVPLDIGMNLCLGHNLAFVVRQIERTGVPPADEMSDEPPQVKIDLRIEYNGVPYRGEMRTLSFLCGSDQDYMFGRGSPNRTPDIFMPPDCGASREHAIVAQYFEGLALTDMGSTHGTHIRLPSPESGQAWNLLGQYWTDNATLRIGNTVFDLRRVRR